MSTVWTVVAVAGAATFLLKSVGPVLLGGDRELVLDERLVGLAAAVVALALRAPILVVVVAAAAATALARAFF